MTSACIIPVHNRPFLIVAAILSVQKQTLPLDEIVVVDDGSTDGTPEVVKRLSKDDGRVRLVNLPARGGAAAARNAGIAAAQCDWICFLDSDDKWMPEKHRLQLNALTHCPQAVASFTGIRYQWCERQGDVRAPLHITLNELRRQNYLGTTSTAMVRRDTLYRLGGFDPTLPSCQDWDLWIRLRRVGEFTIVPEPLVVFNQTERVRISSNKANVMAGHAQLFARALRDVHDQREKRVIKAYHHSRLSQIFLADFRQPMAAVISASKSILHHPTRSGVRALMSAVKATLLGFFRPRQSIQ
jgi:glycosyltransferase involved in cell wall biosynthesis